MRATTFVAGGRALDRLLPGAVMVPALSIGCGAAVRSLVERASDLTAVTDVDGVAPADRAPRDRPGRQPRRHAGGT